MSERQLTIRGIDHLSHTLLKEKAASEGLSLNKYLLKLLKEAIGTDKRAPVSHHELDHLAGTWNETESAEFDAILDEHDVIDPEMWS